MAWRDTLQSLHEELAEVREERLRQAQEEDAERQGQRQQLSQMAESLEIAKLVEDMNSVLLRDEGKIESYSSWDAPEEEPEDDLDILAFGIARG